MSKNIRSYKKNDIVNVTINDIGINGEGIGKIEGYTLFVKDAVIGDYLAARIVKAENNYAYARVENIIVASTYRTKPLCDIARSCGGCQIQETQYETQLNYKKLKVYNNIKRIGGIE